MAGFLKPFPSFACPTMDGKNFVLLAPLYYQTNAGDILAVMATATSDGPSIPQQLQGIIAATGAIWMPGLLHDGLWRGFAMQRQADGTWKRIIPDYAASTGYFREAMLNNGVIAIEATTAYDAVMQFGQSSFVQDLAMPIPDLPDINGFPQPILP
jgi:Protein of unknown function (DUF1353)